MAACQHLIAGRFEGHKMGLPGGGNLSPPDGLETMKFVISHAKYTHIQMEKLGKRNTRETQVQLKGPCRRII